MDRFMPGANKLVVVWLALLVFVGVEYLEFNIGWTECALLVASATIAELALMRLTRGSMHVPWSAWAAALGLCVFFRATALPFYVFAGALAVGSKYVVRRPGGGHIFNPSNLAIVVLTFAFPSFATAEFLQWGREPLVYFLIALGSVFISYRAGKIWATLSFLFSYAAYVLLLLPFLPEALQANHYGLIGPSVMLFASFMITDPRTTPSARNAQLLHGPAVLLAFVLLELAGVRYPLFVASFLLTIANLALTPSASRLVRRFLPRAPDNTPAGLAVCALALAFVLPHVFAPPRYDPARVSWRGVVLGMESGEHLRCSANPRLQAGREFDARSTTLGASWGDYDQDGFDDLLIPSTAGIPTRLYKNVAGEFIDATSDAGLPELYAAAAYFVDYDNDGRLDIFFSYPSSSERPRSLSPEQNLETEQAVRVFRNVSGGGFRDVTGEVGLAQKRIAASGAPMSFSDYDADGDLDFVIAPRGYKYYPEQGVVVLKSILDPFIPPTQTMTCDTGRALSILRTDAIRSFFGNRFDETEKLVEAGGCVTVQRGIDLFSRFSNPHEGGYLYAYVYMPGDLYLYENLGGTFREREDFHDWARGLLSRHDMRMRDGFGGGYFNSGQYFQPISADFDGNGLPDIFVTIDFSYPLLLLNNGGFSFENAAFEMGFDIPNNAMGVDVGDIDRDGVLDMVVSNTLENYVFRGTGSGGFERAGAVGRLGVGWGIAVFDYDLDGFDDIIVTNGVFHGDPDESSLRYIKPFIRRDRLFHNEGGSFRESTDEDICSAPHNGKALAVSDFNNDGAPDVFIGNLPGIAGSKNILYENATEGAAYLKVSLDGSRDNRYGIGAKVSVVSGGETRTKWVTAGSSYYSQNSPRLVFGLGESAGPVDVHVLWPSGETTVVEDVGVNQEIRVRQ